VDAGCGAGAASALGMIDHDEFVGGALTGTELRGG
jgi:hypothetical protein